MHKSIDLKGGTASLHPCMAMQSSRHFRSIDRIVPLLHDEFAFVEFMQNQHIFRDQTFYLTSYPMHFNKLLLYPCLHKKDGWTGGRVSP